jgi:hypothetical protein
VSDALIRAMFADLLNTSLLYSLSEQDWYACS